MGPALQTRILSGEQLSALVDGLRRQGYAVIGPTVRQGAVVLEPLQSTADLPIGWVDEQEGGYYRLQPAAEPAWFGYTVAAQGWKRWLHRPEVTLFEARQKNGGFELAVPADEAPRYAFLGVRPCELVAIEIQDRVLLGGPYVDPGYRRRREAALIICIQCTRAGRTCFCASMGTGPAAGQGFDLALTEMFDGAEHYFLAESGSPRGAELLAEHGGAAASEAQVAAARRRVQAAAGQMGRSMRTDDLHDLLMNNLEHPEWDRVARRCLTCTNCTQVCPTCFCTTVEDATDLGGGQARRQRQWDSCYTLEFSYIHGGSVRTTGRSRYRQWLTHKLATWLDQFGTSGCVGCGRCITWCPVGIDLTAEVEAIRQTGQTAKP